MINRARINFFKQKKKQGNRPRAGIPVRIRLQQSGHGQVGSSPDLPGAFHRGNSAVPPFLAVGVHSPPRRKKQ